MFDALKAYGSMFLLRKSEETIATYYLENKIFSFVHFYIGQEAVAVGVVENLSKQDRAFGNHRSHGHYLAKGGNLGRMYAEMLGKSTGCCHGKGGSMHMLDRSVNFMGTTPILGSIVPISAGSALQQKMSESKNITTVFIGDGASEEGIVYESLNFGSLFKLPLLVVVENNLYSVNTPREDRKSIDYNYSEICKGIDVNYVQADGNDFFDVYRKATEAIQLIQLTNKPTVLECIVYRHMAHSAPIRDDKSGYRRLDTEVVRTKEDSLTKLRKYLLLNRPEEDIKKLEDSIELLVKDSLQFALDSPFPETSELVKDVFY